VAQKQKNFRGRQNLGQKSRVIAEKTIGVITTILPTSHRHVASVRA
jgi:hypothetical protein